MSVNAKVSANEGEKITQSESLNYQLSHSKSSWMAQ